jgi:hypothetical protein
VFKEEALKFRAVLFLCSSNTPWKREVGVEVKLKFLMDCQLYATADFFPEERTLGIY